MLVAALKQFSLWDFFSLMIVRAIQHISKARGVQKLLPTTVLLSHVLTKCIVAAAAHSVCSVREFLPPGQSISYFSFFADTLFILNRWLYSLITMAFSSSSQCFAPRFALSRTASFRLTPTVPQLNRRQVRSTWLRCRHPLVMGLQLLHVERAVFIAHSTGGIKARSCLTGRPEGNRFMGTKASRCCCKLQVSSVSRTCSEARGLLLQRGCFSPL